MSTNSQESNALSLVPGAHEARAALASRSNSTSCVIQPRKIKLSSIRSIYPYRIEGKEKFRSNLKHVSRRNFALEELM
jgi:hypothetical protein